MTYIIFFFFHTKDLCQLVNADAPYWLVGMTEMTRTFGLELLESVLNDFPEVFLQVNCTSPPNPEVVLCSQILQRLEGLVAF